MNKIPVKSDDRVRVEFEGTAIEPSHAHKGFQVRDAEGRTYFLPEGYLTVVEPRYQPGLAYQDADGDIFLRQSGLRPWRSFSGAEYTEDFPTRPLRKLVAESA